MRFIVYGAGGVGSTLGGHLFRTGHEAVLVGNAGHIDRIKESGLRLVTPDEVYVLKIPACKRAEELAPYKEDDVVLLTAKSQHTLRCLGQLKNAGAPRSLPIFCVQNSICNEPLVTRIFDHVYGVMVSLPVLFLESGEVINSIRGNNGYLEVGLYPIGSDERACKVVAAFRDAGFASDTNDFIMKAKAAKCLGNIANSMRAITNEREEKSEFLSAAREEAMKIWKMAGIECESRDEFVKRTRTKQGRPVGYENVHKGSSWQSLMRGTGNVEAEQINGDIVKLGRMLGVDAPHNELLWRLADEIAKKGERPGRYSAEDLAKMLKEHMNYHSIC